MDTLVLEGGQEWEIFGDEKDTPDMFRNVESLPWLMESLFPEMFGKMRPLSLALPPEVGDQKSP
jgi:hypothetical protein